MLTPEDLNERYAGDAWGRALGASVTATSEAQTPALEMTLPFRAQNMNPGGRTHGGKIATYLVDAGRLLAHGLLAPAGREARLLDFQVSYLKGGGRETLIAHARVVRQTREFLFVHCHVDNAEGEQIARSALLFRCLPLDGDAPITHHNEPAEALPLRTLDEMREPRMKMMVDMFNRAMSRLHPGAEVTFMGDGQAQMVQQDVADHYDSDGNIAAGQMLMLLDNTGGSSGASLAQEFGMAVTLTIQAAFIEPARGEALVANSRTCRREGGLTHNEVHIYGAQSRRLKVFGSMTHLVRGMRGR
ncbi:MAG TPA: hotdog fold thioesterase [Gammaproteobacteria bacterium]|nr:hotdog fold thioesterase [Gammaproteobacteria bacterium]